LMNCMMNKSEAVKPSNESFCSQILMRWYRFSIPSCVARVFIFKPFYVPVSVNPNHQIDICQLTDYSFLKEA